MHELGIQFPPCLLFNSFGFGIKLYPNQPTKPKTMNSYTPIQQLPTCKKMNKILFKLGLANFVLLILYLILDFMAWRSILIFPYVASWFWTPLNIKYWTSTTSDFDPVLSNKSIRFGDVSRTIPIFSIDTR